MSWARRPNFHGFDHGESDELHSPLLKFCDLGVCACVDDNVCHDIMCLEVVERYDGTPAGRCRIYGRERGYR
jgi:hypothetical protein